MAIQEIINGKYIYRSGLAVHRRKIWINNQLQQQVQID